MIRSSLLVAAFAAITLTACGGGGTMSTPAAPPGATLSTQTLDGAAGFVSPAGFTVYVFDSDLMLAAGTSACSVTTGCAAHWPPVQPVAGAIYAAPFTVFTRADLSVQQLAYNNHPLYMFTGDTAAGTANGDGLIAFGGAWHVARPQGVMGVTPTGGATPPPGAY